MHGAGFERILQEVPTLEACSRATKHGAFNIGPLMAGCSSQRCLTTFWYSVDHLHHSALAASAARERAATREQGRKRLKADLQDVELLVY